MPEDEMKDSDFRSFFEDERHRLINYVRSMLSGRADMDAEDLVHDVLVRLLEKADSTTPVENVAAYVYRSLRNRVIDRARTSRPTVSLDNTIAGEDGDEGGERFVDLLHDVSPNALEMLQTEQGKQALFEALDTLSDIEREVVIAHEFEGIPFKVLAETMSLPQNTLLSHKARALKKLSKHFSQS
jgi:RNA polymerase sigma-70 factor (ECF subfamily)